MNVRRAVGIIRVSSTRDREDNLASPDTQRRRIEDACERDGLELVAVHEELDVSGRRPLNERAGMLAAVQAIEAGDAEVIVAAYFDRLFRSVKVQAEILERVEAKRGDVLALDSGKVTGGSAGEWLSAGMRGLVAEYLSRTTSERVRDAHARAVMEGRVPFPLQTPGYDLDASGRAAPNTLAPVVDEAFRRRAAGATVDEIRAFLDGHGIRRTKRGVQGLMASRFVLGEIHFGDHEPNLAAHPAIVDRDTWRRVQTIREQRTSAGRPAKTGRLLSRLGVLRCATCGRPMSLGSSSPRAKAKATRPSDRALYAFYRCSATSAADCERRVTVGAEIVERIVVEKVRVALADVEGRASVEQNARDAELRLERAQADLAAAIRAFAGLEGEQAAVERLAELRAVRDRAQDRVDHLGGQSSVVTINAAADWDRLSLAEQRALIRTTVARAVIAPGRGPDRITVELFGQ